MPEPITVNHDAFGFSREALAATLEDLQEGAAAAVDIDSAPVDCCTFDVTGSLLEQIEEIAAATGQAHDEILSIAIALYHTYVTERKAGGKVLIEHADGTTEEIYGLFSGDD